MSAQYDAVIVGGGHNGLICAAYLARAGRKVLVLERRHLVGGAAVTEEVYPGFRYTVCSYVVSLLRPQIVRELELARFGLQLIPLESAFSPYEDGSSLCRTSDWGASREEIRRFSKKDADRYPEFSRAMGQLARFAKAFIDQPAPEPSSLLPSDLAQMFGLGRRVDGLGADLGLLQAKLTVMSATDFLDEWFESERLKAPMSVSGIIGTFLGVRSPGTAYVLLHHYMGEIDGASRAWAFARGGNGAVSEAIAASARHHGAEIRVNAGVERVLVEGGRATGVVLSGSGDVIRAKNVISGAEPRLTFLKLVGAEHLPDDFVTGIRRYKARGSSGKVNLALDRLPDFAARPGDGPHLRGDISIAPSYAYLERAYDDAKYGAFSRNPFVNIVFPSLFDRSMAPEGKHVMSCFVQYAPYDLKEGAADWPNQREAFGDAVVNTLEGYMPGLKSSILHRQVLTPWDLEQEFGLTEGNIFHGELGLEQLMFQRPTPGWARYATPIRGLWLAGSGAHPGGGVMGAPGWLAAQEMLKRGAV